MPAEFNAVRDDELGDYLDGRLSPSRRAEVEAFLVSNTKAAARLRQLEAINESLRLIAMEVLDEPPPGRLLRALRRRRVTS